MSNVKITVLEEQVLNALIANLYAEEGFSDVGIDEIKEETNLTKKVIRGVAGSLVKKDLISIDEVGMEGEHVWYLRNGLNYLVWEDTEVQDRINLIKTRK